MTNLNMPVVFVSHGSPMLAVEKENGEAFTQWAEKLPQPQAVLVFSAHWESKSLTLGSTQSHTKLVYDFYGFPDALYEIQYPAPGASDLAKNVESLLQDRFPVSHSNRGLDHGVWVPFLYMWPNADVPILQMSIPVDFSDQDLFLLGEQLSPLRQQGV